MPINRLTFFGQIHSLCLPQPQLKEGHLIFALTAEARPACVQINLNQECYFLWTIKIHKKLTSVSLRSPSTHPITPVLLIQLCWSCIDEQDSWLLWLGLLKKGKSRAWYTDGFWSAVFIQTALINMTESWWWDCCLWHLARVSWIKGEAPWHRKEKDQCLQLIHDC